MKTLTVLLVLALASGAWAQDWGGITDTTAAAIDGAYTSSLYPQENSGASGLLIVKGLGNTDSSNILVRMASDPHTAGYTQDSAKLHLVYSGGVPYAGESLKVYFHVMKVDWGEGAGSGSAAGAGECSWDSSLHQSADWGTDGPFGSGVDYEATVACSLLLVGTQTPGDPYTIDIDGSHLTQNFFDYGLVAVPGWKGDGNTFGAVRFDSDDSGTSSERPYFEGWESAPASAEVVLGAGTYGAGTYGGGD